MVNRESSKHFENNPFCASTLLLFSLFNKDVYFILKLVQFTTMRFKRSTSKQSANEIYNNGVYQNHRSSEYTDW